MEGILYIYIYIYVIFDHVAAYPLVPICYLLIFAETDLQDVLFRLQALHLLLPRQLSTWLLKKYEKKNDCKLNKGNTGSTAKPSAIRAFTACHHFWNPRMLGRPWLSINSWICFRIETLRCTTSTISFQSYSISFTSSQMSEHSMSQEEQTKNPQENIRIGHVAQLNMTCRTGFIWVVISSSSFCFGPCTLARWNPGTDGNPHHTLRTPNQNTWQ